MYKMRAEDVYGLADSIGAAVRQRGRELFFLWCPFCGGGGKDRETFSVNLDTGAYQCFRASCGRRGHFVQLARRFSLEFYGVNMQESDYGQPVASLWEAAECVARKQEADHES